MHIFFSGIGGTAIGPLALIARQAGYSVSGSDKQDSQYVQYLIKQGLSDIHIGQTAEAITEVHNHSPIDWFVYSSAVEKENPDHPELIYAREQGIKTSKRDELLNLIVREKQLKLVAIAGTHGKTTTTAMAIWLFKQLALPISYSVGAKINFGDMGQYQQGSEYFVYECDEFDRNFLAFHPYISLITGVTWDHHEIFPTREDYKQAFRQFITQSRQTVLWQEDFNYLDLQTDDKLLVQAPDEPRLSSLAIPGLYNRRAAWLAIQAVHKLINEPVEKLIEHINRFPGLQRRMEQIIPNLYSDYAHTPEKVRGAMSVALELHENLCERSNLSQHRSVTPAEKAPETGVRGRTSHKPQLVVVYEPLTNRRQHYMMDDYSDCFKGAAKVYWVPSYLAREDPAQRIIPPSELITHLADPSIAEARERDESLKQTIQQHLDQGDMVVCMAGGGGDSLDEWLRANFSST